MIKILIIGGNTNESENIASLLYTKLEKADILVITGGEQANERTKEFKPENFY